MDSGLLDSFTLLLGSKNTWFITLIGVLFVSTPFANLISWALGINYVACYAAKGHSLPKIFALESKKNGSPIGAAILNCIVASALVLISHFIPNQDFFWNFFALNIVTLLLSYMFIFPAFLKLRKIDRDRDRLFKVPGNKLFIMLISYIPMVVLIVSIIFSVVPLSTASDELAYKLPLLLGTVVAIAAGEFLAI